MPRARILVTAVLLAVASDAAASAHGDAVKAADRLARKAMEDYDNLEFDSAKQRLQKAMGTLRDASHDETPAGARILVSLGMVYYAADHDQNRATNQFIEALKIDPAAQLDPARATPEMQQLFADARLRAPRGGRHAPPGGAPPAGPAREEPGEPGTAEVRGLQHDSVDEAAAGQDIAIHARLGIDVHATRVILFYRSGAEEYVSAPMSGHKGSWSGTIPAAAVASRTVQYYLEARDALDRAAVTSGTADSPYIVTIVGATARPGGRRGDKGGGDREEDPLTLERHADRPSAPPRAPPRSHGRLFVHLMAGTGVGVQLSGNRYEVAYRYVEERAAFGALQVTSAGAAWSPLHGALELGVNINRNLAVSVLGRLQGTLINNADSVDPAARMLNQGVGKVAQAGAGLARLRYNFDRGRWRPAIHVGFGGGEIRHVLAIESAGTESRPLVDEVTADCYSGDRRGACPDVNPQKVSLRPYDNPAIPDPPINRVCLNKSPCYDNVTIGYLLASVGGGVYVDLTKWKNGGFGLIADAAFLLAFGNQFGLHLDVQLGVGAHFL